MSLSTCHSCHAGTWHHQDPLISALAMHANARSDSVKGDKARLEIRVVLARELAPEPSRDVNDRTLLNPRDYSRRSTASVWVPSCDRLVFYHYHRHDSLIHHRELVIGPPKFADLRCIFIGATEPLLAMNSTPAPQYVLRSALTLYKGMCGFPGWGESHEYPFGFPSSRRIMVG